MTAQSLLHCASPARPARECRAIPVVAHPRPRAHGATAPPAPLSHPTVPHPEAPREIVILGQTADGRSFRPSDWSERLAGAMSSFRPGRAAPVRGGHIGYSPYCVPTVMGGVKCVVVNEALRELEPRAWEFVMNFARDNRLQTTEACLLPDPPQAEGAGGSTAAAAPAVAGPSSSKLSV